MSRGASSWWIVVLWSACLLIVPFLASTFVLHVFVIAHIAIAFALSWDLLAGYVGELSLGHSLFFGIGAYGLAFLNGRYGLDPWLGLFLGVVLSGLMGCIIGALLLRLRGAYLSIVTLAFQMVFFVIAVSFSGITGGEEGLRGITRVFTGSVSSYYASAIMTVGLFAILWFFVRSRYGTIFKAIRENPEAAEATGISIVLYKMMGYTAAALVAGLAGGFQGLYLRIVTPDFLSLALSFSAITVVVIGGKGTLVGAVVGGYAITFLFDRLDALENYKMLLYSIILLVVVLFFRDGLVGLVNRLWVRAKNGRIAGQTTSSEPRPRPGDQGGGSDVVGG